MSHINYLPAAEQLSQGSEESPLLTRAHALPAWHGIKDLLGISAGSGDGIDLLIGVLEYSVAEILGSSNLAEGQMITRYCFLPTSGCTPHDNWIRMEQ